MWLLGLLTAGRLAAAFFFGVGFFGVGFLFDLTMASGPHMSATVKQLGCVYVSRACAGVAAQRTQGHVQLHFGHGAREAALSGSRDTALAARAMQSLLNLELVLLLQVLGAKRQTTFLRPHCRRCSAGLMC